MLDWKALAALPGVRVEARARRTPRTLRRPDDVSLGDRSHGEGVATAGWGLVFAEFVTAVPMQEGASDALPHSVRRREVPARYNRSVPARRPHAPTE